MVYSAEVRWFFKNQTEFAVIEKWFNARNLYFAGNWERADIYLQQPGLHNLGVKIREGKVEVKVLLADRGVLPLPNGQSGLVNDWGKYSFGLQESDEENKNLLQQFSREQLGTGMELWVRVDKERLWQKFSVNLAEESITPVAQDSWPAEGCGVELTKIKVNQQTFYTFGLEAFSKSRQEPANLELVLNKIIPEMPGASLRNSQSNSYPGFLEKLYAQQSK